MWLSVPENNIDRVGEHADAVWKFVSRSPSLARRSKEGVEISDPNGPVSLYPRSSATMIRKLGFRWSFPGAIVVETVEYFIPIIESYQ